MEQLNAQLTSPDIRFPSLSKVSLFPSEEDAAIYPSSSTWSNYQISQSDSQSTSPTLYILPFANKAQSLGRLSFCHSVVCMRLWAEWENVGDIVLLSLWDSIVYVNIPLSNGTLLSVWVHRICGFLYNKNSYSLTWVSCLPSGRKLFLRE